MKANRLAPGKKTGGAPPVMPPPLTAPLPAAVQSCCDALRLSAADLLAWAVRPGEVVLVLCSGVKVRVAADTGAGAAAEGAR